jgi:DNA-binding NtrC family response regulator
VGAVPVLVIAPDERWLRVLEVSLKLGGFVPIARRSIDEASRFRSGDERAPVVVLDLGADSKADDLARIREMLGDPSQRMVVILPQRLESFRAEFEGAGASVIVRPWQPSTLYAAVRAAGQARTTDAVADGYRTSDGGTHDSAR